VSDPKKATAEDYKSLFCSYLCIYRAAHYPSAMQLFMHLHARQCIHV